MCYRNDVYIHQAHLTHSTSTILWRKIQLYLMSIQAIFHSFFKFHGKRHYIGFYLRIKKPSINQGLLKDATNSEIKKVLNYTKELREINARVQLVKHMT